MISSQPIDRSGIAERHPGIMRPPLAGRLANWLLVAVLLAPIALTWHLYGLSLSQIVAGTGKLGQFTTLMFPPTPDRFFWTLFHSMGETLAISFLGTLLAAVLVLPFSAFAARNVGPLAPVRFLIKRLFDFVRSIDILIWALIWIGIVGLGPFAGVLAIMTSDFGSLGKLFTETMEDGDPKAVEGIRSTGGNRVQEFFFGLWPQVQPVILGQVLYFFESNTRSATIIGAVGAGGIGLHLSEMLRTFEWPIVGFIVIMILITVAVIDLVSSQIRRRFIGEIKVAG